MSNATLMAPPTPENVESWQFDHAMEHRTLLGAMSPLTRFSVLPYLVDPQVNFGSWQLNHGQAHADAQAALAGGFGLPVTTTIGPTPDLISMDFDNPALLTWWTFANEQQHISALNALPQTLVFPFW